MKRLIFIISIIALSATISFAQEERSQIRKGNKAYGEGNYGKAAEQYDKALQTNPAEVSVYKNSGAANYRNDQFEKSANAYSELLRTDLTDKQKAEAYYNLGNTYMQANKYKESVEQYRNALKLDPTHDKSRHNMAVATKILQQQQQNQQQNGGDNNQQNQDKQDQNKDQQQNQDKQDQNKDKQDQQQQQQNNDQNMSREEMERYLESLSQKEKETQDKVQKAQQAGKKQLEKNW